MDPGLPFTGSYRKGLNSREGCHRAPHFGSQRSQCRPSTGSGNTPAGQHHVRVVAGDLRHAESRLQGLIRRGVSHGLSVAQTRRCGRQAQPLEYCCCGSGSSAGRAWAWGIGNNSRGVMLGNICGIERVGSEKLWSCRHGPGRGQAGRIPIRTGPAERPGVPPMRSTDDNGQQALHKKWFLMRFFVQNCSECVSGRKSVPA